MDPANETQLLRQQVEELSCTAEILRLSNKLLNEEIEQLVLQLNAELQSHNHQHWWE